MRTSYTLIAPTPLARLTPSRGVRRRRRLFGVQIPRMVLVRPPPPSPLPCSLTIVYRIPTRREKGDASKAREYLPADKQYLLTRGVPCLRRATSLAYTDADEDAERLLSFSDSSNDEADEWVETHAGRKPAAGDSAANPGDIDDIPDVDEDGGAAGAMEGMSLGGGGGGGAGAGVPKVGEIPDMDDIPDMEEDDLEAGDDEATAAPKAVPTTAGVIDARCVFMRDIVDYGT